MLPAAGCGKYPQSTVPFECCNNRRIDVRRLPPKIRQRSADRCPADLPFQQDTISAVPKVYRAGFQRQSHGIHLLSL